MALYLALRAAFAASRHVPLSWRYRLGTVGGEAAYWCWASKRRNTHRNMAVVTGERDDSPRARAMARASLRSYGRYLVSFFDLPNVSPPNLVQRTAVQGWEHLDRALEQGRGVIFITGHFGLWDYAPVIVSSRYPGKVHVVAETFSSQKIDAMIQGQRAALGSTVIPMTNVRGMVRALRANHIVALLVDRPVQRDGVPVEFFGRQTMVPAGAATLAAMTGAAILPGFMYHRSDGDYDGLIMPPVEPAATGNRSADIRCMTQGIFSALEHAIARRPHEWYMFRDMWAPSVACAEPAEAFA